MEINEPPKNKKQQKIIMKNIMNSFPFIFVLLKTRRKENERTIFFHNAANRPNNNSNNKETERKNLFKFSMRFIFGFEYTIRKQKNMLCTIAVHTYMYCSASRSLSYIKYGNFL